MDWNLSEVNGRNVYSVKNRFSSLLVKFEIKNNSSSLKEKLVQELIQLLNLKKNRFFTEIQNKPLCSNVNQSFSQYSYPCKK